MRQQHNGVRFESPADDTDGASGESSVDSTTGGAASKTDSERTGSAESTRDRLEPTDWADPTEQTEATTATTDHLHLQSYDDVTAYDLGVEVVDGDGRTVFHDRYYLQPGDAESVSDAVSGGEYEVRVTVDDNDRHEAFECRIDDAGRHTAIVEIGNGTVSLTEGLYG